MSYRTLPVSELHKLAEGSVSSKPDCDAQFTLGQRYARGIGFEKSEALAAQWFQRAADGGHVVAQRYLAYAFLHGRGLIMNEAEGVRRLRIAAERGDAPSQRQLGFHYAMGSGVHMDLREGMHWFRLAADQGDYLAQYNLAFAYTNGRGLPLDLSAALGSVRSKRYSALVVNGVIKALNVEPDNTGLSCSLADGAAKMLAELK